MDAQHRRQIIARRLAASPAPLSAAALSLVRVAMPAMSEGAIRRAFPACSRAFTAATSVL